MIIGFGVAVAIFVGRWVAKNILRRVARRALKSPSSVGKNIGPIIGSELGRSDIGRDGQRAGTGLGGIGQGGTTIFLEEIQRPSSRKEFRGVFFKRNGNRRFNRSKRR